MLTKARTQSPTKSDRLFDVCAPQKQFAYYPLLIANCLLHRILQPKASDRTIFWVNIVFKLDQFQT